MLQLWMISHASGKQDAHSLLHTILKKYYGCIDPTFSTLPGGKPVLADYALHFNLSHSGPFALCGVGDHPLGVDVERIKPRRPGLPRYVLSDKEWDWFTARGSRWEDFYTIWTLKESFCKFTGLGLTRPVSAIPVPLPRQILPSGACLPFGSVCFTLFSGPGWRAAVCSPARCASSIRWLTPGQLPPVGKKIPQK